MLAAWPRDALALQAAHLMDFARGDAQNLRNRVSRVLPHRSASVPGYSYVLGMHAFGLEGVVGFGNGRYADAIAVIEPVRDIAHRFGGRHAQRDILTLTLLEAALRGSDAACARHYMAERLVHKPRSNWGHRLARRAEALAKH